MSGTTSATHSPRSRSPILNSGSPSSPSTTGRSNPAPQPTGSTERAHQLPGSELGSRDASHAEPSTAQLRTRANAIMAQRRLELAARLANIDAVQNAQAELEQPAAHGAESSAQIDPLIGQLMGTHGVPTQEEAHTRVNAAEIRDGEHFAALIDTLESQRQREVTANLFLQALAGSTVPGLAESAREGEPLQSATALLARPNLTTEAQVAQALAGANVRSADDFRSLFRQFQAHRGDTGASAYLLLNALSARYYREFMLPDTIFHREGTLANRWMNASREQRIAVVNTAQIMARHNEAARAELQDLMDIVNGMG